MEKLKYPIGKFESPDQITAEQRVQWIAQVASLPRRLAEAANGLSNEQLDTPYREGGWTVRQVVHHVADSHMNSVFRFRLALTEDHPTIRPYDEVSWAELSDAKTSAIGNSLSLLASLHERWVELLTSMTEEQYSRTFFHPGSQQTVRLDTNLGLYAWHGNHHLAHVTMLKERMGW
ncbi:bacillithiol transferase BstA [Paenibacillus sp. NEAU-GSW1]|nr:bacillithiol transferase BstA [Paenibacillus sp. NEAU-GSW1]